MGQRSDEIKKHIDTQRSELSDNLERLEERVRSTADWRAQVEKRPMTAVGIAFGGGLLLGAIIPLTRRNSGSSTYRASSPTSSQSYTGQGYTGSSEGATGSYLDKARQQAKNNATSRELRKTWDMVDTIRAAMISFGAAKVREYLGGLIPGFDEHYKRTEEEQRRERGYSGSPGMTGTGSTGTSPSYGTST